MPDINYTDGSTHADGTLLITITLGKYEALIADQRFLESLQAYGVDNWDGYDDAVRDYDAAEKGDNP